MLNVKFGVLRDPAGGWGGTDNRPAVRELVVASPETPCGRGLGNWESDRAYDRRF
jgi:hypothetical protein